MAAWLDAIMSPLNAAGEALQKLIETRDLIKFGDAFRKLQAEILAAQRGALTAQTNEATLLERIRELEKEITRFETWENEKSRYEMKALRRDTFVMMLKPDARGSQPPHWLCTGCYNNGKQGTFQWTRDVAMGRRVYRCDTCQNTIAPGAEPQWLDQNDAQSNTQT